MSRLDAFLAQAARTPFDWGRHDCCLWLADWVKAVRGVDPAAAFRGRYVTQLGCARLLKRHGGVLGVVTLGLEGAGLRRAEQPVAGDLGVVEAMGAHGVRVAAGAICTGRRWAMLTRAGLLCAPAAPLAAWGLF